MAFDTYLVNPDGSGDFPTIQDAINAAAPYSEIVLGNGTFQGEGNRDLDLLGKTLFLQSQSSNPEECVIDAQSTPSEPHFGFWCHSGESVETEISGITITGCRAAAPTFAAIMVGPGPHMQGNPDYVGSALRMTNCQVMNNSCTGIASYYNDFVSTLRLEGCNISFNEECGFQSGFSWSLISNCTFEGNSFSGANLDWYVTGFGGPVVNSKFIDNGGNGVSAFNWGTGHNSFSGCEFIGNIGHGLYVADYLELVNCTISLNINNGVDHRTNNGFNLIVDGCEIEGNGGAGINTRGFNVTNGIIQSSEIIENSGPGIYLDVVGTGVFSIENSIISKNSGYGFQVITGDNGENSVPDIAISSSTFFGNLNGGIIYDLVIGSYLTAENSIVCENTGIAFEQAGIVDDQVVLSCVDVFGNSAGDWIGEIASQQNLNGNLHTSPQFCDQENNNYELYSSSLCAEENNPVCGQIGALGIGCESVFLTCQEIQQYDEDLYPDTPYQNQHITVEGVVYSAPGTYSPAGGGYLQDDTGGINFHTFEWPVGINEGDRIRLSGPLWSYARELYIGNYSWSLLEVGIETVPTQYSVSEFLSDSRHIGAFVQVGGTAVNVNTNSFFLDDGINQIIVNRENYTGVSFGEVTEGSAWSVKSPCFNFDGEMGLSPRRQSDMEAGVSGVERMEIPLAMELHPAYPNPFNPRTTISYELPGDSRVELAVYDLNGRLVKRIRSGETEVAGRHEAVWFGQDESGQEAASGVYLYRLKVGSESRTGRMGLMK